MSDDELIEAFLGFKRHNQGRSERTCDIYGFALARLREFLSGRPLASATAEDLDLFTGLWLHRQGVVALSRRPYVAAVREFFAWARKQEHVGANPAARVTYPRHGRKLPSVISLANAERLMWAPDFSTFVGVRDGAIIGILLGCGLRVSGLTRLNQSAIANHEIDGSMRMVLKVSEKGDVDRILPVPAEAEMMLRIYLEHDELRQIDRTLPDGDQVLFVSVQNRMCPPHEYIGERRRMRPASVRDLILRYGERLGIPRDQLHPHALRHLFGTELEESDVSLTVRQELMGHKDPKSTAIYTHLALRKKLRELDRANPLAKISTPASDLLKRLGGKT